MPDFQDEETLLVMGIMNRDNDEVIRILGQLGRDAIRYTTREGEPLLNVAISFRNRAVTKLLLDRGADPSFKDKKGRTALHATAAVDNVDFVVDLLKKSLINAQDDNGDTALHVAVQNTSVEMVKWLIFGGADPLIQNKNGSMCRKLTTRNLIHQILRDHNKNRPPLVFGKLDPSRPYTSEALHFSIRLSGSSSAGGDFLYYSSSYQDMPSGKLGNEIEGETIWGRVVEYRIPQPVEVNMFFPLQDKMDHYYEMVLKLLASDSGDSREVILNVKEGVPPDTDDVSEDKIVYVAHADVTVKLDDAGLMYLTSRPVQQPVTLKKGKSQVTSILDSRVHLSISDKSEGKITGELQLERSAPVKEVAPLVKAPPPPDCSYESQSDYVKLRTHEQAGDVAAELKVELPLPEGFSGGVLNVFVRTTSTESKEKESINSSSNSSSSSSSNSSSSSSSSSGGGSGSSSSSSSSSKSSSSRDTEQMEREARRRVSTTSMEGQRNPFERRSSGFSDISESSASDSEVEDEQEARRWTKKQIVTLAKNSEKVKVPMEPNKTITVVETKTAKLEEAKVKKSIAKQYRKRGHKRALFFVAGRPWAGWRECQEVLVLVTSPQLLSREMGRHLKDGYCLLHVSGEFRVPPFTDFRVSVIGDLLVEYGEGEAVITFQHLLLAEKSGNHYAFVIRQRKGQNPRFLVEQRRKKRKKGTGEKREWKMRGELHFDLASIGQEVRIPSQEQKDLEELFSDQLLLDLAEKLPVAEFPVLAIRLGLTSAQVDSVLSNPGLLSPLFKCFELLRRHRDRSKNVVTFGDCLLKGLKSMAWTEQRDWLISRLHNWPQLLEVVKD